MRNKEILTTGALMLALLYMSLFTVDMTESVVLLELQKPVKVITEPGLYFKIPFIQQTRRLSNQILINESSSAEVLTKDKKNLLIDNFALWKIVDPLLFLQTLRDEANAQMRLNDILYSELRVELGTHDLQDIISHTREAIMDKVTKEANQTASQYGIEVADVRIKRTDLPQEIANSIFNRMRTERERIAKEYRSEGKEEATKIRAETDKEKVIIVAEAYKQEQAIRGEGDAIAIKTYAEAFQKDPDYYTFIRSMEAYKNALKQDTTILLSEKSDFLKFLEKPK